MQTKATLRRTELVTRFFFFLCTITLYYRANSHTLKTLLFTGLFILFLRKNFLRFLWACLGSFSAFFAFTPFFYFFPELERWILPQGMPLFQTTRMRGGLKCEALMPFSNPKKLPSFFRWMGVCNSLFFLRCALKSLSNNLTLFSKIKNTLTLFKLKLSDYFFKQKTLCVFT